MKHFILIVFSLLHIPQSDAQQIFIKKSVYFASDKHQLNDESIKTLTSVIDSCKLYQLNRIIIRGNTDNEGDSLYNITLSEKRSTTCKHFLVGKGLNDSVFKTAYYGENKPIAVNADETGKQKNRRVDLLIYFTKPVIPDTAALVSIKELYRKLERPTEIFCINPNRDTMIRGSQGSVVVIKAGTFKIPTGCKNDCVRFHLKEDFLKSDIILDDLSTTSDGKILESQAMVFTDARDCKDRKIDLQKGKELTIMTPTDTIIEDISLFKGMRTPHDSIMNWVMLNNQGVGGFNMIDIFNCYKIRHGALITCECRFFDCRINRVDDVIVGWFSRCQRKNNQIFRQNLRLCRLNKIAADKSKSGWAQEKIKKTKQRIADITERFNSCPVQSIGKAKESDCDKINELLKKYGVTDMNSLLLVMNKNLLDSFGVSTMQELYDTMGKIKQKEIQEMNRKAMAEYGVNSMQELEDTLKKLKISELESNISKGKVDFEDLKYYIFNTNSLGWSNVDIFAKLDLKNPAKIKVGIKNDKNIDCKLIFKNRRIILPANHDGDQIYFDNIPAGEEVYVVVLKYYKGKAYLQIEELVSNNTTIKVRLEEYSLDELKEKLKMINRL